MDNEHGFDPELLYVECGKCGNPLLWERGDTTRILKMAGVDVSALDEKCMIITEGCPVCSPGAQSFSTQIVRLKQDPPDRPGPAAAKEAN